MIPLRLSEIAEIVGGELHGDDDPLVSGASYVDSRRPTPQGLFVATVGERVDGHDFAAGAHAVLGSRPTAAPTVVVLDPVVALGALARHVLDRTGATVLAVTGSQGKTGTKDYLASVLTSLDGAEQVVATTANHNNEIGVPLTVLEATSATTRLVVEMGARGIGHIGYLCRIAPPQVAGVLNIGSAHVGEFGGRGAIAAAKAEIVTALPADGVAVLNADDPLTAAMSDATEARVLTFGAGGEVTWRGLELDELGRPSFELGHAGEWRPVRLLQPGAHQAANAAAAAAFAIATGHRLAAVADALAHARAASPWRMELQERADGLVVVNDSYNANPESMRAALEALAAIGARGRRRTVAVLGEMLELGEEHDDGHRSVGAAAAALGVDIVVVVGESAVGIAAGAAEWPTAPETVLTAGREEAATWLRQNAGAEDVVLVKASRGAALEWVADRLLADTEAGEGTEQC